MFAKRMFDAILVPVRPKKKRHNSRRRSTENSQIQITNAWPVFMDNGPATVSDHRQYGSEGFGNTMLVFHGTPSASNAGAIFKHGWMTGSGNAYGDGIYLTKDLSEAKIYAGRSGVYLKCVVTLGKTCLWNNTMENRYAAWCKSKGIRPDNSAKTSFLLKQKFDTLKAENIVVVLAPQYANPTAWRRKNRNIRILSVHRADNDRRIRV